MPLLTTACTWLVGGQQAASCHVYPLLPSSPHLIPSVHFHELLPLQLPSHWLLPPPTAVPSYWLQVRSFTIKFLRQLAGKPSLDAPRPVSSGRQSFAFPDTHAPVSQPVEKVEAKAQAMGSAK